MQRNLTTVAVIILLVALGRPVHAQFFSVSTVTILGSDAQPGGPGYDYDVALFEVTNAEFAAFLNDAESHNEIQNPGAGSERGDNMLWRIAPFDDGDVGLIVGDSGDVDAVFDISRSLLTYNSAFNVGTRYGVVSGKDDHPAVGMSWIGAAKFCNWLTIDQGLGLAERCYAEGTGEVDWFPITTGTDVGGTQQATNLARDLNDDERCAWVAGFRGYRMLMDQGGTAVGATNAVPRPYNEWYKAAAYDPAAPDIPRTVFVGLPFEEHTVPPDHWVHGFGRDPLTNADANFRSSGDPFDDPDAAVIATTPVGYYDGTVQGGTFATSANDNPYGIFDMSGNVWEFLSDQVTISDSTAPDRSIAGGSYRSNNTQVTCANRGDVGPGSTRPVIGFRVMRVVAAPINPGDMNQDCSIDQLDISPFVDVLTGADQDPGSLMTADMNGDTKADGADVQQFVNAILSP